MIARVFFVRMHVFFDAWLYKGPSNMAFLICHVIYQNRSISNITIQIIMCIRTINFYSFCFYFCLLFNCYVAVWCLSYSFLNFWYVFYLCTIEYEVNIRMVTCCAKGLLACVYFIVISSFVVCLCVLICCHMWIFIANLNLYFSFFLCIKIVCIVCMWHSLRA